MSFIMVAVLFTFTTIISLVNVSRSGHSPLDSSSRNQLYIHLVCVMLSYWMIVLGLKA